ARTDLEQQPAARQPPSLLERGAERPRRKLGVEQPEGNASAAQLREQGERGIESAVSLDVHVLQVRGRDVDRLAGVGELVEDDLAVELASLQETRFDGPHCLAGCR